MQLLNTTEAFKVMLSERNINTILGVDKSTISNWKKYVNVEKGISKDKMEEMLLKFGATLVSPPTWNLPIYKLSAQDVRVGNIVHMETSDDKKEVRIVTAKMIKDIEGRRLHPLGIRLTDEILQNIGFNIVSNNLYYLQPLHLQKEKRGWFHVLNYGYVSLVPLNYLHEVQNLYHANNRREIQITSQMIDNWIS